MYAYQPLFRGCFGKEFTDFNGRVTSKKIEEFKSGLNNFNDSRYNLDHKQMSGYLDNITHEELVSDMLKLYNLMQSKEVKYLSIL